MAMGGAVAGTGAGNTTATDDDGQQFALRTARCMATNGRTQPFATAATRANLTLRRIQQIRVANPVSPTISVRVVLEK
jgi:hypothetical protein